MTGILVKIPRNICSLSQVKFLVVVTPLSEDPHTTLFLGQWRRTHKKEA